jgi:methionyl-tRNA formyltransferase
MKIIFMGTPDFSVPALQEIIKAGHEVVGVYSQPPRPAGRGQNLQESPVHKAAFEHNIPVFTPTSLKTTEAQSQFASLGADLAVVVAYGLLLPKAILDTCPCINIHASLLPRWRGAAPLQRAIMAGDTKTGITIMQMDEGLDTGDMLLIREVKIMPEMTAGHLHDELSIIGGKIVVEALILFEKGQLKPIKQTGEATYATKIKKEEAKIDWNLPGEQIIRNIRAFNPYPGAFFEYKSEKIKLLDANFMKGLSDEDSEKAAGTILDENFAITCSNGRILPQLVQRQGKKIMSISELLRGFKVEVGARV